MENQQEVIGRFQKSNSASIQVSLVEWEGNTYLDIREVVPDGEAKGGFAYTRKGLRFNRSLVGNLQRWLITFYRSAGAGQTKKITSSHYAPVVIRNKQREDS